MALNAKWVPMKWPCGPLPIALLHKSKSGAPGLGQTLEAWLQPSTLEFLKGSPVNSLVIDWAAGGPEDSRQQRAVGPLLQAGRKLGISFVGRITVMENVARATAAARAAGLSAVILEQPQVQALDLPVILQFPRDQVEWRATSAIFSSTGNVWPGVKLKTMEGDTAIAGPTGVPWVNSNGWFSLLAREMAPGKVLWLDVDPPASVGASHPEEYCLAVADARVYASRWIISLDDEMRAAVLKRETRAMDAWTHMCETISFFESHSDWSAYKPMGVLAVISDFRGENAFMGGEVLNLLNRRQVQFLIMDRPRALSKPIKGLKAILWVDAASPNAPQHAHLLAFVRQGGLLIAATYWGPSRVKPYKYDWLFGYDVYGVDKGRIVVPEKGFQDPYEVARATHLLVGRRNDLVRLYNPATTNCYPSIDSERHKQLVQVLNYSTKPADYVTVWVNAGASSARLWSPVRQDSSVVKYVAASDGTDLDLPTFAVNCAVEFERLP